jgi:hypothetical protein
MGQFVREQVRLNFMRRLQLGFVSLQLELADRDLRFQLTIPSFKPRPLPSSNKEHDTSHQLEKSADSDIGPVKLKQMPKPARHDPACYRCDETRHCGNRQENGQICEEIPGRLLLCENPHYENCREPIAIAIPDN